MSAFCVWRLRCWLESLRACVWLEGSLTEFWRYSFVLEISSPEAWRLLIEIHSAVYQRVRKEAMRSGNRARQPRKTDAQQHGATVAKWKASYWNHKHTSLQCLAHIFAWHDPLFVLLRFRASGDSFFWLQKDLQLFNSLIRQHRNETATQLLFLQYV